jgi:hypothetical protein
LSNNKIPSKEYVANFLLRLGVSFFDQSITHPWLKEKSFYNPKLKEFARQLRNDSTKTEIFFG